jgi:hypothetical protein
MNNDSDKLPDLNPARLKDTGWIDLFNSNILNGAVYTNFNEANYGRAEVRFKDGEVIMRGLIKKISGAAFASNDILGILPFSMTPRTERRMFAQSCTIKMGDRTSGTPGPTYAFGQIVVDTMYFATTFLILDGVRYFVD